MRSVTIIGGGLAGCEAAYQLAKRGYEVTLYEMRGVCNTPCHHTDALAELVCSNSLKSVARDTASGMLKAELEMLDCLLLRCGYETAVPAGGALAVDRVAFSEHVTQALEAMPNIRVERKHVTTIDPSVPTIVAAGPLASDALAEEIARVVGVDKLAFYDAVAPIVAADSIDYNKAFFAARYDKGTSDYLNLALTQDEYLAFYQALIEAKRAPVHGFEQESVFEGCMPIEVMAARGVDTMRYGPMRPVGIRTPDGKRPYAVVQLRKENVHGTMYNLVGFQTNLLWGEQQRVFRMLPGLEQAEFLRYGVMHRNTFLNAPPVLQATFGTRQYPLLFFAGQITGVEGYVESIASGLLAACNLHATLAGLPPMVLPETTILGQLQRHVSTPSQEYQPMNANYGILVPLTQPSRDKKQRKLQYTERGLCDLQQYLEKYPSCPTDKAE